MADAKETASAFTASGGNLALPRGSLILVTGATGFIGANVVYEALKAGYKVRGTSRSEDRAKDTHKIFNNNPNYSAVAVPDIHAEGAFDEALKDVDAVIHMATDTSLGPDPNKVSLARQSKRLHWNNKIPGNHTICGGGQIHTSICGKVSFSEEICVNIFIVRCIIPSARQGDHCWS